MRLCGCGSRCAGGVDGMRRVAGKKDRGRHEPPRSASRRFVLHALRSLASPIALLKLLYKLIAAATSIAAVMSSSFSPACSA